MRMGIKRGTVRRKMMAAQSLMAVEKPDQALAWAEKGLAKKDDPELMNIREYVLATRKVPY